VKLGKEPVLELAVITTYSPQPPLTTLHFLKKIGVYKFLPEENVSVEELKKRKFSDEFCEFWQEAQSATISGEREGLRSFLEEKFSDLKTRLDMIDFRLQTYLMALNTFLLVLPLILSVMTIFTGTEAVQPLVFIPLCSLPIALVPPLILMPREMSLKNPRPLVFAPIVAATLVYFFTRNILLLALLSIPSSALTFIEEKKALKEIEEAGRILRKAAQSPNIKFIEIKDPEELLERGFGFSKALLVALYIQLAFLQTKSYFKAVSKLLSIFREYHSSLKKIRERAGSVLLVGLIIITVAAASFAIVFYTVSNTSRIAREIPYSTYRLRPLSEHELLDLRFKLLEVLAAMSLALSVLATTREANPLYFPLYLPLLILVSYFTFEACLQIVPLWLGTW